MATQSGIWQERTRNEARRGEEPRWVTRRYCDYYVHNGGGFDFTFFKHAEDIINQYTGYYITKFERKGKIYSLSFSRNETGIKRKKKQTERITTIVMKDSLNLLPFSQKVITKSFNVMTKKGTHPFKFISPQNLYTKVSEYDVRFTDLMDPSNWTDGVPDDVADTGEVDLFQLYKEYNISDTQGLYQSLAIFFRMLSTNGNIDIGGSLTAPSLAIKAMKK